VFLFYCKNFNYKNYSWIKKYFYLINPVIAYTVLSSSWNYINKKRKRVKKKILRNLLKSSKIV
jgi:hypothetical protein